MVEFLFWQRDLRKKMRWSVQHFQADWAVGREAGEVKPWSQGGRESQGRTVWVPDFPAADSLESAVWTPEDSAGLQMQSLW